MNAHIRISFTLEKNKQKLYAMKIKELYGKPFSKTSVFLFPLLGIAKNAAFTPISNCIALENIIEKDEKKLVCLYDITDPLFKVFEQKVLVNRKNYLFSINIDENKRAYIFDFSKHAETWNYFLEGRYSRFNDNDKKMILKYFNDNYASNLYVKSYLYPEYFFNDYASILDVDVQILKEVGELCSKPTFDSEKLKIASYVL